MISSPSHGLSQLMSHLLFRRKMLLLLFSKIAPSFLENFGYFFQTILLIAARLFHGDLQLEGMLTGPIPEKLNHNYYFSQQSTKSVTYRCFCCCRSLTRKNHHGEWRPPLTLRHTVSPPRCFFKTSVRGTSRRISPAATSAATAGHSCSGRSTGGWA